jgi:hypothetical protein
MLSGEREKKLREREPVLVADGGGPQMPRKEKQNQRKKKKEKEKGKSHQGESQSLGQVVEGHITIKKQKRSPGREPVLGADCGWP